MTVENTNFLNPKFGYSYEDLYNPIKLKALAEDFYNFFESKDKEKSDIFSAYRNSDGKGFSELEISNVLIDASYILSDFIVELFQIGDSQKKFIEEAEYEKDVLAFKSILQKKIFKKFKKEDLSGFNWTELDSFVSKLKHAAFPEYDFENDEEKYTAKFILELTEIEKDYRWFYEGDKFAPDDFVIPDEVRSKAEKILSEVRSLGILNAETSEVKRSDSADLKFILDELEKWIFAKKYFDQKTKSWVIYSGTSET